MVAYSWEKGDAMTPEQIAAKKLMTINYSVIGLLTGLVFFSLDICSWFNYGQMFYDTDITDSILNILRLGFLISILFIGFFDPVSKRPAAPLHPVFTVLLGCIAILFNPIPGVQFDFMEFSDGPAELMIIASVVILWAANFRRIKQLKTAYFSPNA
jgi:hypothetical protein